MPFIVSSSSPSLRHGLALLALALLALAWALLWVLLLFAARPATAQHSGHDGPQGMNIEAIVQAETEAFKQQRQAVEEIERHLPDRLHTFEGRLEEFMSALNRLVRLKGFVGDNFRELLLMRNYVERLHDAYQDEIAPLETLLDKMGDIENRLMAQKEDLQNLSNLEPPQGRGSRYAQRLRAFDAVLAQNAKLQNDIQAGIAKSETFQHRLENMRDSFAASLTATWKSYYFGPVSSVFSFDPGGVGQDLRVWWQSLPVYFNVFLLGNIAWPRFFILAALLSGALILFTAGGLRRVRKRFSRWMEMKPFSPLLLVCLGLGAWGATAMVAAGTEFVPLLPAIQILLLRGLLQLLWSIRLVFLDAPGHAPSPITSLWWLFAISILVQGLNLPATLLVAAWPLVLAFFAYWLARTARLGGARLERNILRASCFAVTGLALLALLGWVNASLLLSAYALILALALQFGTIAESLLKIRLERLAQDNAGYLRQGLIRGVGIPMLWILSLLLAVLWLGASMGNVQFLRELTELDLGWGAITVNIFRLFLVLIGFYLARSGLIITRSLLDSMSEANAQLDPGTTATLKTLLTYIVWALYIVLALAFLGLNLTSLAVVAGGLSVGIGFGMQSMVNNFISGLILLFGRNIKPGDVVQIGDLWAEVKQINIRTTVVETFDKSALLLPNSKLIDEQITNWTLSDNTIRRTITVGVMHGSDIDLVKRLLLYIAETHPDVFKNPLPFVRFIEFGDSSLRFCLYFFAHINTAWDTESALRFEINAIFREYSIQLAYPQQDLHIKSAPGLEPVFSRPDPESSPMTPSAPE